MDPGRNGERDFQGEKRSNETHVSTTDPDARLYKKAVGQKSRLCYMGHVLMENRNSLAVDATLTHATGTAEREATLATLVLRARQVTPHIAVQGTVFKLGKVRKTAIDKRTLRHQGYVLSLRCRKRIEEVFGWIKAQAGYERVKVRGKARVTATFTDPVAAYNLIRLPKLIAITQT